jgi:peptidyl-prolyl cis-trans isomerase SurA
MMAGRVAFRAVVVAALLSGSAAAPLLGWQEATADTVDRMVAIVGNTIILNSEVDEEVFSRLQGRQLPQGDTLRSLRRQVLTELIDLELLYQLALTDTTVKVTDEEVTSAVDEQMRNVRSRYPSDEAFRNDLRTSGFMLPEEYRRWFSDRQRRQLITNTLIENLKASGKLKPVVPTDKEMRTYFEAQRQGQKRPATISFRQIVMAPLPTVAAVARARALADSILAELRKGADFATAARRFSQDPASREQGGSLGWFRRGVMVPAFENVAFSLRPGPVSEPVETPFGFHLIQVERVQPAEVLARHILITAEITPANVDTARAVIERAREAISAGASFDSVQRRLHDQMEEKEVRDFPMDKLLPSYAAAFESVPDGVMTPVFRLESANDPVRGKFAIVEVLDRKDAGEFRFEEVKDNIRGPLGDQLALRRFLDRLRAATYVEVRET